MELQANRAANFIIALGGALGVVWVGFVSLFLRSIRQVSHLLLTLIITLAEHRTGYLIAF